MKKFEYAWYWLDSFDPKDLDAFCDKLNEFGRNGWEMIQIDKGIAFLKREI